MNQGVSNGSSLYRKGLNYRETQKQRNLDLIPESCSRDTLEMLSGHGTVNKWHNIPLPQSQVNAA